MINAGILALSLLNAMLLFWLGLTVLLNAERRSWGLWLTSGGLLGGGAFFLVQAAIAGQGLQAVTLAMRLQWPLGWVIGLALPLAWYGTILWYAGFMEPRRAALRRRHLPWVIITVLLSLGVFVLIVKAVPYPLSYSRSGFHPFAHPAYHGVPLLAVTYPVVIFLTVALALDALYRKSPSPPLMIDQARRRARPWLAGSTIVMLVISVMVGAVMVGVAVRAPRWLGPTLPGRLPVLVVLGDLVISGLVTVTVLLLGQAVVASEIFSGGTLPRRGLRRQWYGAITLAVTYGLLMALSFHVFTSHVWGLLLSTFMIAAFFALFNWRSYVERERYRDSLRPFVTSARVYDAVLEQAAPEIDATGPFHALAAEVLEAALAYLIPVGPLSSLAAPPLAYPEEAPVPADVSALLPESRTADALCFPVDPRAYGGAVWAVPLWSERGLIGLLLLGSRANGGAYSQEEIEIARATGERLIDTLACGRMAQRLMALQRARLAESQVADRRTRRLVHDEILPALHSSMLALSGVPAVSEEQLGQLAEVHRRLSELLREMPTPALGTLSRLGLVDTLQETVEDEFRGAFDEVTWEVDGDAAPCAQALPLVAAEVTYYAAREAIRNAARHARGDDPQRRLHLRIAVACRPGLTLTVEDDGVGGAYADLRGGRGMALHSTMMAVIGGEWTTESVPGEYTRVTLALPEGAG